MSILQCYNAADCCTLCYFCTDEKNSCAASTILFYTDIPFLKRTCTSKIQNFLLNQFLYHMGTLWIKRQAFWELFQAGGYLKSFSVEDNYVATPHCTSHTLGRFKSYSQQLVFSWFTAEQSQIVECVAFVCSTQYMFNTHNNTCMCSSLFLTDMPHGISCSTLLNTDGQNYYIYYKLDTK